MSPRQANPPTDEHLRDLRRLGQLRDKTDVELRAAVLAALDSGGSVRTIAEAAGISTATVQSWKRSQTRAGS